MVSEIPAEDIKCGGRGISALIINKNNKTVFIQFLPIKSCIRHYKEKICSIFYCEIFDIMVSYMYERKSITAIMKYLKGISGRKLFERFPEIRNQLWKGELWNHSYYVETVGSVSEENIRRYIEHQSKAY